MNKEEVIKFLENAMERKTRKNEETFYAFQDGVFDKIKEGLYEDGFEIKDFYYNTLDTAFNDIKDFLGYNDNLEEFEIFDHCEADVYTYDLTKWLNEDVGNYSYCNDAIEEYDLKDMIAILQEGQKKQMEEIYQMAVNVVNKLFDEDEE